MEPEIRARYTDAILHDALHRYGIAPDQIRLLDGFESYIYEYSRNGADFILRIGHSRRRTAGLIQGEVEWINYLAAGGAGVARAVLSEAGKLVEAIDDGRGGQFLATAFVKAPGCPAWEFGWTPALYEAYGRLIGRIHALSKQYTPSDPAIRRPDWDDPKNLDTLSWLPEDEPVFIEKAQQILAHLHTLPRDANSYGLIHQDAHSANFFVAEGNQITLFDFDDCVYGWYIYDIAMVVFYMVTNHPGPSDLMQSFWPCFWQGYCAENTLDRGWLSEIPWFLKLREIDLYAALLRSFGSTEQINDPWPARYMRDRKRRIAEDVPVVEFDFLAPA
ncbi:MAG: phosphotransferase [Chloroflexi bacterium]|nr:phosphotransferase [Chloroflexota bacterium]